jgi:hypothetical protein
MLVYKLIKNIFQMLSSVIISKEYRIEGKQKYKCKWRPLVFVACNYSVRGLLRGNGEREEQFIYYF